MTSTPWHDMACPACGDTDSLDVAATVWVRLTWHGSDADESCGGSHEWDGASACTCAACGWSGTAAEAEEAPPAVARDTWREDVANGDTTLGLAAWWIENRATFNAEDTAP